MFRKTLVLAALATTLAAGSAFAATSVTGQVTRTDTQGDIWLNNGTEYGVGTTLANSVLPGDSVTVTYTDINGNIDVWHAAPVTN